MVSFYLIMFLLPFLVIGLAVWLAKKESRNNG
jgi:hypothetical protein